MHKLGNFSEIFKFLSVKSKMSGDILSLFSKFGLGHLLCRLSLGKHDGISAVQLILSLCLFLPHPSHRRIYSYRMSGKSIL